MSCIPYPKPDAVPDWKLYNICSPASGSDHAGTDLGVRFEGTETAGDGNDRGQPLAGAS